MTSLAPKSFGLGELGDRTLRKVRRRVMPLIVLLYFVAYLDRNNVGFAKLTMSEDIGLNSAAYGLGAGIFFLGYALLEVPSNAGMYRFGARKWLARILITWGIFATAMCLVNGETTYYFVRFLLGAAEAGFFPAILFYLTLWFPAAQRVTVLGIFILAQPVSNALGAPVSGLLLQMDGVMGLQGWQWLYIIEGIPAIALGLLTPILMTDRPRDAKWLEADERNWLTATMDAELAAKSQSGKHNFMAGLKDKRTLVYSALYFGLVCGIYGLACGCPPSSRPSASSPRQRSASSSSSPMPWPQYSSTSGASARTGPASVPGTPRSAWCSRASDSWPPATCCRSTRSSRWSA